MKAVQRIQLSPGLLAAIPVAVLADSLTLGPPVINGINDAILFDVFSTNDTWFSLQTSGDLETWQHLGNHQVQLANRFRVSQPIMPGEARRFFRAQTPPPLRLAPANADLPTGAVETFAAFLNGSQDNSGVTWSVVEAGGGSVGEGVTNKQDITIRQLLSLTSGLVDSPAYGATNGWRRAFQRAGLGQLRQALASERSVGRADHPQPADDEPRRDHTFLGHLLGIP